MKIYSVVFNNLNDCGNPYDAFILGVFSSFKRAEEQANIFIQADDYVEVDRDKGKEECHIYYQSPTMVDARIDISELILDEFSY